MEEIIRKLYENQDLKYRDFNSSLSPTVEKSTMIGVRTPVLRNIAKEILREGKEAEFLKELPHTHFEENQIHAFILSERKDYNKLLVELRRFLPYIDNWATCDQLRPKVFKRHTNELFPEIEVWISSEHTYMIRFAIGMLMSYYLDDAYEEKFLKLVSEVRSEEYYVNMMIAWYFATALAKQYEDTIKIIEQGTLDKWVHNKTIQKAKESFRISEQQKEYLKSLRK